MRIPRIHVPGALSGERVELSREEALHLVRVLRRRAGDRVELVAGHSIFAGVIETIESGGSPRVVVAVGDARAAPSTLPWTVGVGLVKSADMEIVVRQASELGLGALVPIETERSQIDAGRSGRPDRWRRIAAEAAKQCGRANPLEIGAVASIETLLAGHVERGPCYIARPGGETASLRRLLGGGRDQPTLILVGPEGGFTENELARAASSGAASLDLGGTVLRTSTAVVLIAALGRSIELLTDSEESESDESRSGENAGRLSRDPGSGDRPGF
jgi:16S rRNA (uracil1498-N3)-methyltransferase